MRFQHFTTQINTRTFTKVAPTAKQLMLALACCGIMPMLAWGDTPSSSVVDSTYDNTNAVAPSVQQQDATQADSQASTQVKSQTNTQPAAEEVGAFEQEAAGFEDPFFGSEQTSASPDGAQTAVSDPLEPYNRFMFGVNSSVDKAVVKPIAQGYKTITPEPARKGVGNFFNNLGEPLNAANLLLQGRPTDSLKSLGRFSINTLTSLGFADPAASKFDLVVTDEDFGQTLGVWGMPSGAYIVLPVLGPSTLRDTAGRMVDGAGSPLGYAEPDIAKYTLIALAGIDKRAKLLALEGLVNTDDYALIRDVYLEKRAFDIADRGANGDASQAPVTEFDTSFGD